MPFTNKPSGATVLSDFDFATRAGGSPMAFTALYPTGGDIVADAGDPESPSSVYRAYWFHTGTGNSAVQTLAFPAKDDIFVGFTWKPSNPFTGWGNLHNKIVFLWTQPALIYMNMMGASQGGPYSFWWSLSQPGVSNSHLPGWGDQVGSWNLAPNASGSITLGTWYRVEIYARKSTTASSRDGILRCWLNNTLAMNYSTVNLPGGWTQVQFAQSWDAAEPNFPSAYDEHRFGHVHVSTGGTPSGGGGGTPPPVVLQDLTPANASIASSGTQQYVVSMSGPVPSSVSMFTISSNTAVATVPSSVTVNAGSSTALFTATAVSAGSTTISTSYNGVNKSATLQVQSGSGGSGSPTTYDYQAQYSGTQGSDNWYYLDDVTNAELTYDGGAGLWRGPGLNAANQVIWGTGFHTGYSADTKLRWLAPGDGSAHVTGAAYDTDATGGTGCIFRIKHNGTTLFTRVINNGDTTGGAYDVTVAVRSGDAIDFVLSKITADYSYNSTNLDPVIEFSASTGQPDPPPPDPQPVSVIDLFTAATTVVKDIPFTMTVRLSQTVDTATAVEIRVGSTSLLTAPTSVTVDAGESEEAFTVTPIAIGLVSIDAILNATKRVNLSIQSAMTEPDPEPEQPEGTARVAQITPSPDGALVSIHGFVRALAFAYDAHPAFITIDGFRGGGSANEFEEVETRYQHVFTWPSGTTRVIYRAQGTDEIWTDPMSASIVIPPLPPIPPASSLAVIDRDGVEWQLRGKGRPPYQLYRNRTRQNGMLGIRLRKSGEGYMEMLQVNGRWIRREGESWVTVT